MVRIWLIDSDRRVYRVLKKLEEECDQTEERKLSLFIAASGSGLGELVFSLCLFWFSKNANKISNEVPRYFLIAKLNFFQI